MENALPVGAECGAGLDIRLLGTPAVVRDGVEQALPGSRKVLMLLAYLVLAPRSVPRTHLCDLLWDGPNDPRGELRWCLSKLRRLLDADHHPVVQAQADHVALLVGAREADVLAVQEAARGGLDALDAEALGALAARFAGPFAEGLPADRTPHFETWLSGQRRHFRTLHLGVLERLCEVHPPGAPERLAALERRAALDPEDLQPHLALLAELAERRDFAGGDSHLAATVRLFESVGLDASPLRGAWRGLRATARTASQSQANAPADAAAMQPARPMPGEADARADSQAFQRATRRPRLAILPPAAASPDAGALADALTHDVITRLARLRSLAVIAWGSVNALARRGLPPEEAAAALRADYLVSGVIRQVAGRERLSVELVDTATQSLLWSEAFDVFREDGLVLLDRIGGAVVASLTHAVEIAERDRALVKPPGSLDAWETYHRGLWHMYQFTEPENRRAQGAFADAARLDPTFARAHAGLSFTHWQSAFQRWGDVQEETMASYAAASRSLLVDDLDPTAHWAMGRALWLRGGHEESLAELRRAVDISPSFALGHYAIAFVQSQSGDPAEAIRAAEQSRQLSPFDPLLFGTYGALAMAHARLEQFEQASHWALLAAAQPNAHRIILAIAAHCLALDGRTQEAGVLAARLRESNAGYTTADFLATFHFSPEARRLFLGAGRRLGLA